MLNQEPRLSLLRWLPIALVVIILDQITKQMVLTYIPFESYIPIVGKFFGFTHKVNPGAAFSFLSTAGGWQRWFFIVLALGISTAIIVWLKGLTKTDRWFALALTLILGGAVGNVIDRIIYGHVIDFILCSYQQWSFPAFNVADSAITVGATIIVIMFIFNPEKRREMLSDSKTDQAQS